MNLNYARAVNYEYRAILNENMILMDDELRIRRG